MDVVSMRGKGSENSSETRRIPWSGNLDEDELNKPGGLLLAALIRCANERRQQLNEMSYELGVTYGYINQLRTGIRQVSQISDDFALSCARYLMVPRLTVLMLAGRITPADAYESDEILAAEIPRALAYLCDDAEWGPLVTSEIRSSKLDSHFLVVRLYEKATGKKLLPERLDLRTLAGEIEKLHSLQDSRKIAVDAYLERKRKAGQE